MKLLRFFFVSCWPLAWLICAVVVAIVEYALIRVASNNQPNWQVMAIIGVALGFVVFDTIKEKLEGPTK